MALLPRPQPLGQLRAALRRSRVVAMVGPRQCGKTTLARQIAAEHRTSHFFDLEDPAVVSSLAEPQSVLGPLRGLVVLDEIQRRPELFPLLRVLVDRKPIPARFLVLGSASPELLRQASESLAGRVEVVPVAGFSLAEAGLGRLDRLWLRGGLPPSFTARSDDDSLVWRRQFVQTFLERDLPVFGIRVPAPALLRFWSMLAHYHGQLWNGAELARSMGINETTARRHLDLLESFFMVRVLTPWHANLRKRQVKSPKVYFRDSGILHALLGVRTKKDLWVHPKYGASWEGLVVEEVLRVVMPDEAHFWATHSGAELDLVLVKDGRLYGIECKRTDAPRVTPSIRHALADLELERVFVVYPGDRRLQLADRIEALPVSMLDALTATMR